VPAADRLARGDEGRLAHLHVVTGRPRLGFGKADARDLRLAVDAGRNLLVIDAVLALTGDDLDRCDTFV
jgi:hypothetical protein